MSADMLLRVSRTLKARIEAEPEIGVDKVWLGAPPLASARLDGPRLGLFLYRIVPCADLRSGPRWLPPAKPGELAVAQAGLPLDLHFLITAFGPEDETGVGAEQLILLGGALRAIERGGPFAGDPLQDQVPRLSIDPLSTEELSRIWSLFPTTSFQTSVGVLASPVWIGLDELRREAPVTTVHLGHGQEGRSRG
jgi:hypothetical protein